MFRDIAASITFAALLLAATIPAWLPLMPEPEGKLLPVVSKFHVEITQDRSPKNEAWVREVEFNLTFEKFRQCELKSVVWRDIRTNKIHRMVETLAAEQRQAFDPIPTHPTGSQTTGPWRIRDIYSTDFNHMVAVVIHQCHPLWQTLTQVWP